MTSLIRFCFITKPFYQILGIIIFVAALAVNSVATAQNDATDNGDSSKPTATDAGNGVLPKPTDTEQNTDLSRSDLMYHILVAELAVRRGQLEVALDQYRTAAYASPDPRIAARANGIAAYLKNHALALNLALRWFTLDSTSDNARQAVALSLLNNKRIGEALDHLQALLQLEEDNPQLGFTTISNLLGQLQDKDTAWRAALGLRQRLPESAYAHYLFALASLDIKNDQQTLDGLNQALKYRPEWREAQLLRARVMLRLDQEDEALADLKQTLEKNPDDYVLRMGYARILVAAGQLELAQEQFELLAKQKPDDAEALFALGVLAAESDQYSEADTYFKQVLALGKRLQETYYELGKLEEEQKNYALARDWYLRISDTQRYIRSQVRAAAMSAHLNEITVMREQMDKLRIDNPDDAITLHLSEADILREIKHYDDAFTTLDKALQQYDNNPELRYARALAAEKVNRLDIVEKDLKSLIEENPDHGHALNALGYTLADRTDRYQEALAYLERAIVLLPDDAAVLDSMGWVQYRLGNYEQAVGYLRRAYDSSQDSEIVAHLSEVLWTMGNKEEALSLWQEAFNKEPDNAHLLKVKQQFDFKP